MQAKTPSQRIVHGLLNWEQTTYATGYASLLANAMRALQSLVVNTTIGDEEKRAAELQPNPDFVPALPLPPLYPPLASDASGVTAPVEQDLPEERARYRKWFAIHTALNLVGVVLAIVGGNHYARAETDTGKATFVQGARCVFTVVLSADDY